MSGIVIQIQGDGSGAAEALQLIENKMRETRESAHETSDAFRTLNERIEKGIEYTGIYLGVRESIDAIKELIGGSVELGEELGHLSRQTGISAQNLSLLKVASQESGIEFEALTKGFKKLGTSLLEYQENSRTTVDAFKLLNISQKDLAATGGDVYKVMGLVADRMSEMPDGWKKSAAAVQLFGRAGQQLIPMLDQGSAGISQFKSDAESMGLVLDESGVAKMEEFYRANEKLKLALEGFGIKLTEAIEPAITKVANALTDGTITATDWASTATSLAKVSIQAAESFNWLGQNIRQTVDELLELNKFADPAAYALDAKFGFTEAQRKAAQERHDAAVSSLAWAKQDHAESVDEEKRFDAAMTKLYVALDNPVSATPEVTKPQRPSGNNGIAPPSSGRGHKRHGLSDDDIDVRSAKIVDEGAERELRQLQEISDAKLKLSEALDRAEEQKATSHSQSLIAILEAQHAAGLESDADFYKAKRKLQEDMFDAEKKAYEHERDDLQSAINAEPKGSQKSFELQAQLVSINTRVAELADRRKTAEEAITAELHRQVSAFNGQGSSDKSDVRRRARDAQMAANTVTQMLGQLASASGRDPLRQVTDQMVSDIERLALKMMEERWILPMMQSMFGMGVMPAGGADPLGLNAPATMDLSGLTSALPSFATGGDPTVGSLNLVGEKGPELFVPKGPGTIVPNDALTKISQSSGGDSHGPNVTVNVSNNSSQPVTMRQTGMSYDAQAKHFVLHTVLEDLSSGGPMSQAMKGFGG